MKRTSTSPKAKDKLLRLGAVVFWLLLWQIGSMLLNQAVSYTHLTLPTIYSV